MRKGKLKDGRAAWFHGVFSCGDEQLQAPVVVVELEGGAMDSVDVDKFVFDEPPTQAQATVAQQLKVSTMRILEELQDRACKVGLPIGLSNFTDYIRSLYPEYYSERMAKTV